MLKELKHMVEEKSSKLLWLRGTTNEWPLSAIDQYWNVDKYKLVSSRYSFKYGWRRFVFLVLYYFMDSKNDATLIHIQMVCLYLEKSNI